MVRRYGSRDDQWEKIEKLLPGRVLGEKTRQRFITVDHGTEFQSRALEIGPMAVGYRSTSFGRTNPWKMPSMNRLNGRLRDEY